MSGIVATDKTVEMVTSSEDSILLPPYLVAKRPSEVAVGRAWMRVQTLMTSLGKFSTVSPQNVIRGPRISWDKATTTSRHLVTMALKLARDNINPIQIIDSGVVAPPTKPTESIMKPGNLSPVKKSNMPNITAKILGLVTTLLISFADNLCSNSQIP